MEKPELYIALKSKYETRTKTISLDDICTFWDAQNRRFVKADIPLEIPEAVVLFDYIRILPQVQEKFPDYSLQNAGETQCCVTKTVPQNKLGLIIKTTLLCIILFFGGAIGIISFNEDVNMRKVHTEINTIFTGEAKEDVPFVSIPYSLGILAGFIGVMGMFKRKKKKKPGLLDLDIMDYEEKVKNYIKDKQP